MLISNYFEFVHEMGQKKILFSVKILIQSNKVVENNSVDLTDLPPSNIKMYCKAPDRIMLNKETRHKRVCAEWIYFTWSPGAGKRTYGESSHTRGERGERLGKGKRSPLETVHILTPIYFTPNAKTNSKWSKHPDIKIK